MKQTHLKYLVPTMLYIYTKFHKERFLLEDAKRWTSAMLELSL